MATHGKLTVGKLKHFLSAFSDDTEVVIGQRGTPEVISECHANTYYPEGREDRWPMVVIDEGED